MWTSPRLRAAAELERRLKAAPARFIIQPESLYLDALRNIEKIPGAIRYLPVVKKALQAGIALPPEFRDHRLNPAEKMFRSVIVGELDNTDITFILIYRKTRAGVDFFYLEQHDDAYATLHEWLTRKRQ